MFHNDLALVAEAAGFAGLVSAEYVRVLTTRYFPATISYVILCIQRVLLVATFLSIRLLLVLDGGLEGVAVVGIHSLLRIQVHSSIGITAISAWNVREALPIVILRRVHAMNYFAEECLRHLPPIILANINCIMIHFLNWLETTQLLRMVDATHGVLVTSTTVACARQNLPWLDFGSGRGAD